MNLLEISKTLVDASQVSNMISGLKWVSESESSKKSYYILLKYSKQIDLKLGQLSELVQGYHRNSHPINLTQMDMNSEIIEIVNEIKSLNIEIRTRTGDEEFIFDKRAGINQLTIMSENPGSYLDGIAINGHIKKLEQHPMNNLIEILNLQDYPFYQAAEHDSSLWKIYQYCPRIKVIRLFGAELQENELINMKFEKMPKLLALDLSENDFQEIPECIFKLTNLKHLALNGNNINLEQIEKLRQTMRNTYIDL